MNALKELKEIVSLEKITSIIYSSHKGDLEYSIPETFELLESASMEDVPVEMSFNGKDFKIIVKEDVEDGNYFALISFSKPVTLKVVPESLEPQYWSKKHDRLLPYKDEDYLAEEKATSERKLKEAIENVESKRKNIKEKVEEYYKKECDKPEPFTIFGEYGNYYVTLPQGIEFENSVAIFKDPKYSSYQLNSLPDFALKVVDYSGYALFEKNQSPLRILGGTTFDFSLSKYEEENPELAKVTKEYYNEYKELLQGLIKSDFVYPVLGISWSSASYYEESTKELIEKVAKELKELL